MASTYGNDLRLEEIGDGEQSGSWGATTNTNLELIAEALSFGTEAITTNADTHTTTIADGATDPGRSLYLKYTGTLDSTCTITIAPNSISKTWYIENGTSGSQSIIISQGSGANVTIPTGQTKIVYSDGAGSGAAMGEIGTLGVTNLNVSGGITSGNTTVGTLDTSGAVNLNLVTDSTSSTSGALIVDGGVGIAKKLFVGTDLDVNGTTNLDAVDIDGAVQIDATVNVGVDDTGYDVKFFGDTASAYMQWDASADDLILGGAAGLVVPQDKLTIASTAVTSTAAELNQLDAITRGSILYGNASGATARLAKGGAGTVLTSDGTDISWGSAGAAFNGATNTLTGSTTLSASDSGEMFVVTAVATLTLPAASNGVYFLIHNEHSADIQVKANGTQKINNVASVAGRIPTKTGIIICADANEWYTISGALTFTSHKISGYTGSFTHTMDPLATSVLIGAWGSTGQGAYSGTSSPYNAGGGGGAAYAEKYITSSLASSYAGVAGVMEERGQTNGTDTTVAGMTAAHSPAAPYPNFSSNSANALGRAGGIASNGDFNANGGAGSTATGGNRQGGGGGSGSRAGVGGASLQNSSSGNYNGGGTGGNNSVSGGQGAAATAKASGAATFPLYASETFQGGLTSGAIGVGAHGGSTITLTTGETVVFGSLTLGGGASAQNSGYVGVVSFLEFF